MRGEDLPDGVGDRRHRDVRQSMLGGGGRETAREEQRIAFTGLNRGSLALQGREEADSVCASAVAGSLPFVGSGRFWLVMYSAMMASGAPPAEAAK